MHSCGHLTAADWVLECDWPDVERLRVTASQIRDGSDDVRAACIELLTAASRRIVKERDRDILLRRLGLRGNSTLLMDIGIIHGIGKERARQIVRKCLGKLRIAEAGQVFQAWPHVRGVLRGAPCGCVRASLTLNSCCP